MVAHVRTLLLQYTGKVYKFIGTGSSYRLVILILLFLLASLIRLKYIHSPGVLVEREFTSAIYARSYFFDQNPKIEPWRTEIAHKVKEDQPILEPPVTDYIVSLLYRAIGREELWYSKLLTINFWLVGGIFLFHIIKKEFPIDGALVATAYYLLVPSGIAVSISFQPDALMMMMFLISLYCIMRYFEKPSMKSLLLAATVSGLTLLIRPLVVFALFGVFISLSIHNKHTWKVFFDQHFVLYFLVSLVLPAMYYGYAIIIDGFMRWKITTSFLPYLFLRYEFWKGWFLLGVNQVGLVALLLAVIGFFIMKTGSLKALAIGLGIGYFFFALLFNYHISTHPYYHLQLLPLISICMTPTIILLINTLKRTAVRHWWLPALAASLILLATAYFQVKDFAYSQYFEDPNTAREIGEIVNHEDETVFLAYHYGLPLEYYGEFYGKPWPRSMIYGWLAIEPGQQERSVQERIKDLGYFPKYFIITNFKEYTNYHKDLKDYLVNNCSILAQTDQYLIYNSCIQ